MGQNVRPSLKALSVDWTNREGFLHEVGLNMSLEWEIRVTPCAEESPGMTQGVETFPEPSGSHISLDLPWSTDAARCSSPKGFWESL